MLELGFDPITLQWQIILPALHLAAVVQVFFHSGVYSNVCDSLHWTSPADTGKCPECFEMSQAPSDTARSENSVRDRRNLHLEPQDQHKLLLDIMKNQSFA